MPSARWERTRRLILGMWLVGIGLMILRDRVWPDVLLLLGSVRLVEAYRHPERRSFRVGVVLVGLALLIGCRLSLIELLILAGATLLVLRPPVISSDARKPIFDARLE
ncbi:hypothetical protein [Paludisphaera sp.]|uniref:hypothetical protein n=1 Tax=Paludisphaera sp. TaxID=2017432 RepID=UPI00301CC60C